MGSPSVGILLHELIKLMYHAKVRDPIFFRIGTCGGIGLEGGTVVISDDAVNGMMKSVYELVIKNPNTLPIQLIHKFLLARARKDYESASETGQETGA